jgi:hypothetical protein
MSKTDELISKLEELIERQGITISYFRKYSGESERITRFMDAINKVQSEISSLKEQIKKEETLLSNVKKDKLKGIIREVIWQYCYGKGSTDALFNYKDIEDAAHDVTDLYFQPE